MTTKEAQQLVQKTFQNPFDKDRFVYFIKNLVNEIDESKTFHVRGYVHEKYRDKVKTYERVGTYTDPKDNKIDILIVYLQKESSIDRARTTLRNFVGDYLKERGEKEAGLIAFVSPNQKDWRFSLVKMEYKITEAPSGRVKAKKEFTPAKRYSFLVGVEETSHTAQSRLVPILEDDAENPTLKSIEEAFNIEKVTKEFFGKYRELFLWVKETLDEVLKNDKAIKADFDKKNIDTVDFGKKLLGQIVFLYFLQKKGWFGVKRGEEWGSGSKRFLRELFEKKHGDYKNFFNEILEPLFYEVLRLERTGDYYSRFDCRIPFLNGGLFDPLNDYDWVDTDIELPNEIFSNDIKTKEGDVGSGILDIFDRYNFTVKEDEPLEKEVAVDPEMLGKVFENLLDVKNRKSKGTYYTPREIVHYMCQESLVNYLATELEKKVSKKDIEMLIKYGEVAVEHDATSIKKKMKDPKYKSPYYKLKLPKSIEKHAKLIDEKLETIRICDPAVGSGAFPVGMMNEIIRTRNALTSYLKTKKGRTIYNFKRHAIQNSLYGVDMDLGAVEIAKLRLWLSLIVEEEERETIQPLPNLDYKIVQGNSLSSVEQNLFNQPLFAKLEELKPLFFNETNASKKQEYKKQIDELIRQITNNNQSFDFKIYFSEVFHDHGGEGFNVVIANPPYKFLSGKGSPVQELINQGKEKEAQALKRELDLIALKFPKSSTGCRDFYKWFVDLGSQLVGGNGVVTYITPNTFITLPKYEDIRTIIFKELCNIILIDLGFNIFEEPVVPSAIFISQKTNGYNDNWVNYSDLKEVERATLRDTDSYSLITENLIRIELKDNKLLLYKHPIAQEIYSRCEFDLKKFLKISEGEHSLKNDFSRTVERESKNTIPVINDSAMRRYVPAKIVYLPKSLCLSYDKEVHSGDRFFIRKTGDKFVAVLPENNTFAIAHQNVYVAKPRGKFDTKLFIGLLSSKLMTFLYQNGIYGQKNRTMAQFRIYALYLLPTPSIEKAKTEPIIGLVNKIFAITKDSDYLENSEKKAKVRDYEKQIDQLVYKLYALTPKEIKVVEQQ